MALLTKGNGKLGASILHFDLPAGPDASCPGASTFCASICYARKGHFMFGNVQSKYSANFDLLKSGELESNLAGELQKLASGTVIRLHTSGDFVNVAYVQMWHRLAVAYPALTFYAYTRSWRVPVILAALESLRRLPNVTVWASHDPSMPAPPPAWPVARIVRDWVEAPAEAHCPEQTGKRANCAECGLCFNAKLRDSARLAFKLH